MNTIIPIKALKDNYIWAIVNKDKSKVIIVDPGDAKPVFNFLHQTGLTLTHILITHHHWDHTNGIAEIIKQIPATVIGSAEVTASTIQVSDNTKLHLEDYGISFNVIAIPGHTHHHVAYHGENMLFCGDTLFAAGCGRLFEGTTEQMYQSLQKLYRLPDATKVYCGHEYTLKNLLFAQWVEPNNLMIAQRIAHEKEKLNSEGTTLPSSIFEEKNTNPFLRCEQKEVIASVEEFAHKSLHHPVEVFQYLRQWKDNF